MRVSTSLSARNERGLTCEAADDDVWLAAQAHDGECVGDKAVQWLNHPGDVRNSLPRFCLPKITNAKLDFAFTLFTFTETHLHTPKYCLFFKRLCFRSKVLPGEGQSARHPSGRTALSMCPGSSSLLAQSTLHKSPRDIMLSEAESAVTAQGTVLQAFEQVQRTDSHGCKLWRGLQAHRPKAPLPGALHPRLLDRLRRRRLIRCARANCLRPLYLERPHPAAVCPRPATEHMAGEVA